MAIVVPGKFIFLCTAHTDEDLVSEALKQVPGAIVAVNKRKKITSHARIEQVRSLVSTKVCGLEKVFCFIRNPYDVIVDWYLRQLPFFQLRRLAEIKGRDPTLLEFLHLWSDENEWVEPYLYKGRIFYHAEEAQYVLRYERGINNEVNSFLRKIPGVPAVTVTQPPRDPNRGHWSSYYDEETYAFVNEYFKKDFVAHGYHFLWK